ncbi:MAG: arylamine N-acetyltransferase [Chloroflexia bacterium]|nr:arylamine N-acetyltransferase [Chloroflexia bacterium]
MMNTMNQRDTNDAASRTHAGWDSQALDVTAYLERIAYDGPTAPTVETLGALSLAHLRAVPFENLDIHLGRPIRLEQATVFDKIVRQRRGGFCYELNGLFASLLRALGYRVELLSAQFSRPGGAWSPEFDHLMLRVYEPGDETGPGWLVDVGRGRNAPTFPVRFGAAETQTDPWDGVAFRMTLAPDDDGRNSWLSHRRPPGEGWTPPLRISAQPRQLPDFAAMCHWQQTAPDSHFTKGRICTRLTEDGRITLSERTLIVTRDGQREERELAGEAEVAEVLRTEFRIDLPATGSGREESR